MTAPPARPGSTPSGESLSGMVVHFYAFDIAYEMRRGSVDRLLGQPVEAFAVGSDRRRSRQAFTQHPQTVLLPEVRRQGPFGSVGIGGTVTFLPVGAVSVALRIPFAGVPLERLGELHDPRFPEGTLGGHARALVARVGEELRDLLVRPHPVIGDAEAYTVFCVHPTEDGDGAAAWLSAHRRQVAALLTGEGDAAGLSPQQVDDSTARSLSYCRSDVAVIDWDRALLVDHPSNLPQTLHVLELANLQLAELSAFDLILDGAVERSYREVARRFPRNSRRTIAGLRELRLDLVRLSDELINTTKFFGDWHLARVYHLGADRFHLDDWRRSIEGKIRILDDLYQLLRQDQNSRYMLILEVMIVVLFLFDVVVLLIQMG